MKRICKRIFLTLLCVCTLLSVASCNRIDSYSATMLVRHHMGGKLSVSFSSLNGRLHESFAKQAEGEGAFSYTASLGEGSLSVSYEDEGGALRPLFSLKGGESVSDVGGYIEGRKGKRIHFLIETDGKCRDGRLEIQFYNGEKI